MYRKIGFTNYQTAFLQIILLLTVLYWTSFHSYILFHSLVEIAGATILFLIFIIVWNARKYLDNDYFLVVGIGSLFVGAVALLHMFTYKGMNIFSEIDANLPTQLWIAGRYLTVATFLAASFTVGKKINRPLTVLLYLLIFLLILLSTIEWKVFPTAYIEGKGLTDFKINSEYIISFLFVVSSLLLYLDRRYFNKKVRRLIILSLLTGAVAEVIFTEYVSVYGVANLLGHLVLLISFYLLYLGVVETGLRTPSRLLYKNLRDSRIALRKSQEALSKSNETLAKKVEQKTGELEKTYEALLATNKVITARNILLEMANTVSSRKKYLDETVKYIRDWSACQCVGIRVLNDEERIPYESYVGFTTKFWESENWLSVKDDQCACIRVIRGDRDHRDKDVMNSQGTFYCNNMQKLNASLSKEEGKRYRGVCVKCGYSSVAIIPIRFNGKTIGAVHLADKSGGKVQAEVINFIESIIVVVGESINKFNAQESLDKSNRALAVLSEGNHILIHSRNEKELLGNLCKMIVETGGYAMAWAGFIENGSDGRQIMPVAQAGIDEKSLSKLIAVSISASSGKNPSKIVIDEGKTYIRKNMQVDPAYSHLRSESKKFHFRSSISIPLKKKGAVFGAISIYAKESDAFDQKEIKLLEELADDLAFGINNIRVRKSKEQSEKQLVESYQHLGMINRKISVLLDLDKNSNKRKDAGSYILETAINLSRADVGLLYKFN